MIKLSTGRLVAAAGVSLASLLLALAWFAYAPGLHGGFLFDDFGNLPALGESGPIDNWPALLRWVTSGHADPIGRPLSMLSFLLDAHDWPADAYPFKRTNLLLHLCNGALLMVLLRELGHLLFQVSEKDAGAQTRSNARWRIDLAAILGAAIWLLHPLFVSTTLYIVQREAMLPLTFTLIGLLLWLHGRNALHRGQVTRGILWTILGLGLCTLLAVLCKANGILLPALALVLELILLQPKEPIHSRSYRQIMYLLAWLPSIAIATYLVWQGWHGLVYGISSVRPWTLGQRLLTEPRILIDYLALLWMPRPFTAGLFNDQFVASISLWSPPTTLLSILSLAGLLAIGWQLRRRHPAVAAAIFFFFVAQSLESSTVALELYFEHRNYLPAALMFWPLALWLCNVHMAASAHSSSASLGSHKRESYGGAKLLLALAIVLGLAAMTHAAAKLWGNSIEQSLLWAKLNPNSFRAQVSAAQVEMSNDRPTLAVHRLRPLVQKFPDQVQLALNLLGAECQAGDISTSTINASRVALSTTRDPGGLLTNWFVRVIDQTSHPPCPELTPSLLAALLDSGLGNNHFQDNPGRLQDIYYLKGYLALAQRLPQVALQNFNHALSLQVRAPLALQQAALLGATGYPDLGLAHLAYYASMQADENRPDAGMPRVHAWVLGREHYWPNELARLRVRLAQDAAHQRLRQP